MQRFIFRVDANETVGTGHLMRCLTLAAVLKERGAEILFVTAGLPDVLAEKITQLGFQQVDLGPFTSKDTDAAATIRVLNAQKPDPVVSEDLCSQRLLPDWLVVDHYGLDALWERQVRPYAQKIMVIDDLADRVHDCDLLLEQNDVADSESRYQNLVPEGCRQLIGPQYALLRPEFLEARKNLNAKTGDVKRVLVSFGGSDPAGQTLKVLEALNHQPVGQSVRFEVVAGPLNPALGKIRRLQATTPTIRVHENIQNMAALMSECDLMIGASGTTLWEADCLGLPSLLITVADNQEPLAAQAHRRQTGIYLGASQAVNAEMVRNSFLELCSDPLRVQAMGEQAQRLVDGLGVHRVADVLLSDITLREARPEDCDNLYQWRNHPEIRRFSRDAAEIQREDHQRWFEATLADARRMLLIGVSGDDEIGVLRYDADARDKAVVSVYLVPGCQGKGYGTRLLQEGSRWLQRHHPEIVSVEATILVENPASQKAFEKAGYRFMRQQGDHMMYEQPLSETSRKVLMR